MFFPRKTHFGDHFAEYQRGFEAAGLKVSERRCTSSPGRVRLADGRRVHAARRAVHYSVRFSSRARARCAVGARRRVRLDRRHRAYGSPPPDRGTAMSGSYRRKITLALSVAVLVLLIPIACSATPKPPPAAAHPATAEVSATASAAAATPTPPPSETAEASPISARLSPKYRRRRRRRRTLHRRPLRFRFHSSRRRRVPNPILTPGDVFAGVGAGANLREG